MFTYELILIKGQIIRELKGKIFQDTSNTCFLLNKELLNAVFFEHKQKIIEANEKELDQYLKKYNAISLEDWKDSLKIDHIIE